MQCKVPGCKLEATRLFAMVPVCETHKNELQEEAIYDYNDRRLFKSIRQLTPWKDTEPGDTHKAIVKKMRKGVVTIYEIKGGRYVLDHPSMYKGVKAK